MTNVAAAGAVKWRVGLETLWGVTGEELISLEERRIWRLEQRTLVDHHHLKGDIPVCLKSGADSQRIGHRRCQPGVRLKEELVQRGYTAAGLYVAADGYRWSV